MDIKPDMKAYMHRRKIFAAILTCGLAASITAGAYSLLMKDIKSRMKTRFIQSGHPPAVFRKHWMKWVSY